MIEQSGKSYASGKYRRSMAVSDAKVGKTSYLISQALGVFPGQRNGGLVSSPRDLHVIAVDAGSLDGVPRFLKEICGASDEALDFNVYNMQDDIRQVTTTAAPYNMNLYNTVMQVHDKIAQKTGGKGTPVVIMSSITGLAMSLERAVMGAPKGRGYGDQDKWQSFGGQLTEIQNAFHIDNWHMLWEGHLFTPAVTGQGEDAPKSSLQISGKAGAKWGVN